MSIDPPWAIYVDEAGAADFGLPHGARKKALAVVAVAVPALHYEALRRILPRDDGGTYLKASSRGFSLEKAVQFATDIVASHAEVGAMLVDTGAEENIELSKERHARANEGRRQAREKELTVEGRREHRDITLHDLHYLDFMSRAVLACFEAIMGRQGKPTYVDIVLDSKQVNPHQGDWFVREFQRIGINHGIKIRDIVWRSEEEEPLLLLPDLFGGILCREERYRDAFAAASKLWDAVRAKRFIFANKPPQGEQGSGA